jgi:cAMP-dependent protein kinase regulator
VKPERLVRDAERALEKDPQNLALRLRLAAALRAANRHHDALDVYRSVAVAYQREGRLLQALAVCRSILELAPEDLETNVLFGELEAQRTGASGEEPTRHDDGVGRRPVAAAVAERLPAPPPPVELDDFDDEETRTPPVPPPLEPPPPLAGAASPAAPPVLARIVAGPAMDELASRLQIRHVAAGEVIVREGEAGDSLFVVAAGRVRVTRGPAALELSRLGPGSFFGELALLGERRRHATVQAVEPTQLYEIPRAAVEDIARRHPEVQPALERLYRERLIATLVAHAPFFQPLPQDQRLALMTRFAAAHVPEGQVVLREGDRGGGLYLVLHGGVEITRRGVGGRPVRLASLDEGGYFGEMSPLAGTAASATVTTTRPTELAFLSREELHAALSMVPSLVDDLRRDARRRERANEDILCGETDAV